MSYDHIFYGLATVLFIFNVFIIFHICKKKINQKNDKNLKI